MLNYFMNQGKIRRMILRSIRTSKHDVVYGGQALNAQIPAPLRALKTSDWDVYTNSPRATAKRMQGRLDRLTGRNDFYSKPALHPNTHRVMHKGFDGRKGTRDDFVIVDYSKKPRRIRTVQKKGVRYEHIDSIKAGKKRILADPQSAYRHAKDRSDLERIRLKKILRR